MGDKYYSMKGNSTEPYSGPEVTEYGSVESLTLEDKCGTESDMYSSGTPLSGSVVPDGEC